MRNGVLQPIQTRLAAWLLVRSVLLLVGVVGAAALSGLLLDAALDLSDSTRALTPWFLAGIAALVAFASAAVLWRLTAMRVARKFERINPALGNRLTNAVQLAAHTSSTPVEEFFRLEAVELGREATAAVKTWRAARKGTFLAALLAGGAVLAWMALAFFAGEVWQAVGPRFLDPHGDHPPYSQVKIEVTPKRAEVLYGGQLEVRATANGRPVDKLWLVALPLPVRRGEGRGEGSSSQTRALMFLAPDKSFFQTLVNLQRPSQFFVTDGRARSHRFPVGIRYTPQITLVEVTTMFPSYTGKPPHTEKLAEEPQALPADTQVSFRIASNRPLKSGKLALTPVLGGKPLEVTLQPGEQGTVVTGGFTLTEPAAFTLSVRDVDGYDCAEPKRGRFNLRPDERPRLHVLEPGRNAVATPSIRIPVRVQAEDDYGIERVLWLRGHNRSIERSFTMKLTMKTGPQSVDCAGTFDLEKLGVKPGDVIDYYFEAIDNYPRGPNVTLSRMYRLDIISKEKYEEILKMAAARKALFEPYFKLGAWLRRLAERARKLESKALAGKEADLDNLQPEAKDLAEQMQKYENELGKVMDSAMLFDIEQAFRETLVTQHSRLGEARKKLKNQLGRGKAGAKELSELAKELSELSQSEEEEVRKPAEQIASVAHVLAKADEFVKLAQQQAALAQLLRRFADKQNLSRAEQMEVRELAYQQQRVQEGLGRLTVSLPELLAKVPDEAQYEPLRNDVNGFIQAVAEAKIDEDQAGAVKALNEPDTMTGYALANTAAEKMDKLISKCSGLPKQGQQCLRFRPSMSKLGNTMEQILAAMGANSGSGNGGRDGYSLFNDDAALYGPNMDLAGGQGGRREDDEGAGQGRRFSQVPGESREADVPKPGAPGRVRLQPDANFPLRYRDLVGEYFRAIAETGAEEGGKK